MEIVPVTSNILRVVGYDEFTRILVIELKDGLYKYNRVPLNIFDGLMSAPSKGTFYTENIKFNFSYECID